MDISHLNGGYKYASVDEAEEARRKQALVRYRKYRDEINRRKREKYHSDKRKLHIFSLMMQGQGQGQGQGQQLTNTK